MKWLVSAFEPFGHARTNSSQIVCERLARENWGGKIRFEPALPVRFADAWDVLRREVEREPAVEGVLALGQAEGRKKISLERVALNWIDARIPDNAGVQPSNVPVRQGAPDVLWSAIPWQNFLYDGPVERSYSAGSFVCNTVMFQVCEWSKRAGKLGGFVHFPLLESQKDPQYDGVFRLADDSAFEIGREILNFVSSL